MSRSRQVGVAPRSAAVACGGKRGSNRGLGQATRNGIGAPEGSLPGKQLVEDHPEGVDVGLRADDAFGESAPARRTPG